MYDQVNGVSVSYVNQQAMIPNLPNALPFKLNLNVSPQLQQYVDIAVVYFIMEVQNNSGKNPARIYTFNYLSRNTWDNQDFYNAILEVVELIDYLVRFEREDVNRAAPIAAREMAAIITSIYVSQIPTLSGRLDQQGLAHVQSNLSKYQQIRNVITGANNNPPPQLWQNQSMGYQQNNVRQFPAYSGVQTMSNFQRSPANTGGVFTGGGLFGNMQNNQPVNPADVGVRGSGLLAKPPKNNNAGISTLTGIINREVINETQHEAPINVIRGQNIEPIVEYTYELTREDKQLELANSSWSSRMVTHDDIENDAVEYVAAHEYTDGYQWKPRAPWRIAWDPNVQMKFIRKGPTGPDEVIVNWEADMEYLKHEIAKVDGIYLIPENKVLPNTEFLKGAYVYKDKDDPYTTPFKETVVSSKEDLASVKDMADTYINGNTLKISSWDLLNVRFNMSNDLGKGLADKVKFVGGEVEIEHLVSLEESIDYSEVISIFKTAFNKTTKADLSKRITKFGLLMGESKYSEILSTFDSIATAFINNAIKGGLGIDIQLDSIEDYPDLPEALMEDFNDEELVKAYREKLDSAVSIGLANIVSNIPKIDTLQKLIQKNGFLGNDPKNLNFFAFIERSFVLKTIKPEITPFLYLEDESAIILPSVTPNYHEGFLGVIKKLEKDKQHYDHFLFIHNGQWYKIHKGLIGDDAVIITKIDIK